MSLQRGLTLGITYGVVVRNPADEFPTLSPSASAMATSGSPTVVFTIRGPIRRADLPGLCDRVCGILGSTEPPFVCDVAGVEPDAVTVDALGRLQLAAQRRGCGIALRNASVSLLELVELMGLDHVLVSEV